MVLEPLFPEYNQERPEELPLWTPTGLNLNDLISVDTEKWLRLAGRLAGR